MLRLFLIFVMGIISPFMAKAAVADNAAVAFVYFQIHDNAYDIGGLSPENFNQHLRLLQNPGYNISALDDILDTLKVGKTLENNTIAITFEGAFNSTYQNALKPLIARQIPFTLFFATDRIDRQSPQYMTWDDLRSLKKYPFVSFGLLPSDYQSVTSLTETQLKQKINNAISRTQDELGIRPAFFAIPYGIYNQRQLDIIQPYNFKAVLGQHSGVIHADGLNQVLPRFSLTDGYGDTDRFESIARSKPLYLTDIIPQDHDITPGEDDETLTIGFTRDPNHHDVDDPIACFGSTLGKLDLHRISDSRFEIRLPLPVGTDRLRINCTQPFEKAVPGEKSRSRWYGMLYSITLPNLDGDADFFAE